MSALRKRGFKPRYWWDFDGDDVIVETDDPRYQDFGGVIVVYQTGTSAARIAQAETRIKDLQEGRAKVWQQ